MSTKAVLIGIFMILLTAALCFAIGTCTQKGQFRWDVHDMDRPQPPVITPAEQPGQPPSDAIILFDGKNLSQWLDKKANPANWKVENGYMQANGTGDISTKQSFGDCQLHLEWAAPTQVSGSGQKRGNSGVFLMSNYEVQILDSYDNKTYPDGQAAALYGQFPPLANACRKPGDWQSFDIIFRRPKFSENGQVIHPACFTVLHNGVLVHDNVTLYGASAHKKRAEYHPHADRLPIILQDHGNPIRFRNIWIRELPDSIQP